MRTGGDVTGRGRLGRYKRMAEMYWKKTHPSKAEAAGAAGAAAAAAGGDSHHAARAEDRGGHGARGGGQFHFDAGVARRVFESWDRELSGYLEIPQLLKVAEEIWGQLEPDAPQLGQESKQVRPDLDTPGWCDTWRAGRVEVERGWGRGEFDC